MRESEVVLRRETDGWWVTVRGLQERLDLPACAIANEAVALVRARYVYGRLGVRAEDIGPAASLAALASGHGNVIWLRR